MSKYNLRGVSADKEEVHAAIKGMDKGLFPTAFCKILPDFTAGDTAWCNIMHADTAGTKTSLAYLYWRETGDLSVWQDVVQDAIVMNTDDMACVGCLDNIILSSTIGRNKARIPGEVLKELIGASAKFVDEMAKYGVQIHLAGGETADVGDIVRTLDVGFTAFARMRREELIINQIRPGQVIVGLASYGQSTYESSYNSGIGSNGLTMARHELFREEYRAKYPESYAPEIDPSLIYAGPYSLDSPVDIDGVQIPIGKLALSPTRTFLPVLAQMLAQHRSSIKGIIHATGGGHTKVLKYCDKAVSIIKDKLLTPPPLFKLIQSTTGTSDAEMYKVFNMGTRLEIYTDAEAAGGLIDIAHSFKIEAQVIGRVEAAIGNSATVTIHSNGTQNFYTE